MISAYVLIKVTPGTAESALRNIKKIENIKDACMVTGIYDIIAQIQTDGLKQLGELVAEKIHNVDGVTSTVTCIIVG